MDGYAYPNADINGMNVLLREDGARRLYFGDFRGGGGTFRATSRDGRNYTFEAKVLAGPGLVNDVKKFRVGADCYYLMGLHENRRRLWQTISTNGLAFPPARELLAHPGCGRRLYRGAGLGDARGAGVARAAAARSPVWRRAGLGAGPEPHLRAVAAKARGFCGPRRNPDFGNPGARPRAAAPRLCGRFRPAAAGSSFMPRTA